MNFTRTMCPKDESGPMSSSCHLVYAGHNMIGNEMHWLPNRYLERWWDSIIGRLTNNTVPAWNKIPKVSECMDLKSENLVGNQKVEKKHECRRVIETQVDSLAQQTAISARWGYIPSKNREIIVPSWAPVYASLPVLRVTMTRDPFSWLASKYLWHALPKLGKFK